MKKVKFFSFFCVVLVFLSSMVIGCRAFFGIETDFESGNSTTTPFASFDLLESIADLDGAVNWKVARFFALNELDDRRSENNWSDAWLSEYPLVIYNSETGNPRYYEFRVMKGDKEIGAISCAADKGEGAPVQYVMPFVNEVKEQSYRSVMTGTGKFIDSGYPGRLIITQQYNNSSRSVDTVTDTEVYAEYPVDVKAIDFLLNATKDELELLGIDSNEVYENCIEAERKKGEQLEAFWQEVDELTEKIISMSEEELKEVFGAEPEYARISTSVSYSNEFVLADWNGKTGWYRPGGIYCGPDVIAFVMLGLGTKSSYNSIPSSNNYSHLKNYYEEIQKKMGEGPKLFHWIGGDSLNGYLEKFTNGKYSVSTHWGIPAIVNHEWEPVDISIRENNLPAISLRLPKIERIEGGFHYRTIIGTRKATTTLKTKILWWTVTVPIYAEGQYLMHDNGADSGTSASWWEGWNLYQFQAASVVKN